MNLGRIGIAVAVAGTLDIAAAMIMTASKGKSVVAMLQGLASGPFGDATTTLGTGGAMLGLLVHFAIMTVMVFAFALAIGRTRISLPPLILGPAYGVLLYLVMYWIVLPLRWPEAYPATSLRGILVPVAIHIFLVGLPIALIVSRSAPGEGAARSPVQTVSETL